MHEQRKTRAEAVINFPLAFKFVTVNELFFFTSRKILIIFFLCFLLLVLHTPASEMGRKFELI